RRMTKRPPAGYPALQYLQFGRIRRFAREPRIIMSIFDRFKLTGKRLFITGGSRGLGREMALAIADAGADVILVGRDPVGLEKAAGGIPGLGRQGLTPAAGRRQGGP